MSVSKSDTKYIVKVDYKPSYDITGNLTLDSFSQTFSKINENATPAQIKAFADALMSYTIYRDAPYRVTLIDTSELVLDE